MVSSHWRRVSHSTPRLWSQILVWDKRTSRLQEDRMIAYIRNRITLSKAVPWDILLSLYFDKVQRTVTVVSKDLYRCRSLRMLIKSRQKMEIMLSGCLVDMPLLENLAVYGEAESPHLRFQQPNTALYQFRLPMTQHRLASLRLESILMYLPKAGTAWGFITTLYIYKSAIESTAAPAFELRRAQLTSGSSTPTQPQQGLEALAKIRNLERLSIGTCQLASPDTIRTFQLQKLHSLKLSSALLLGVVELVKKVDMPALRDFSVTGSLDHLSNGILEVLALKHSQLEKLEIRHMCFEDRPIVNLLVTLPHLGSLSLEESTISFGLISALFAKEDATLCPELAELNVAKKLKDGKDMPWYHMYGILVLQGMVESRRTAKNNHAIGLTRLILRGDNPLGAASRAKLAKWVPIVDDGATRRRPAIRPGWSDSDDGEDEEQPYYL